MADTFQWLKLILDNWKTLLTIFTLLTGWVVDNNLKADEIKMTQQQVAAVAEAYYPAVQQTLETKTTIVHTGCSKCDVLEREFNNHMRLH